MSKFMIFTVGNSLQGDVQVCDMTMQDKAGVNMSHLHSGKEKGTSSL